MVLYQPEFFGSEDFFFAEPVLDESFPPHLHRCLEWMYLVSGSVELQLEEGREVLSPGQGALLLPGTIHSFRCLTARFSPRTRRWPGSCWRRMAATGCTPRGCCICCARNFGIKPPGSPLPNGSWSRYAA